MSILVTGGTGYIGSHTALKLFCSGESVVLLDNFSNSKPDVLRRIEEIAGQSICFYEADILDSNKLAEIFNANEIEGVIHFAGLKAVGESVEKPLEYYRNNVAGTLALLEVCRAFGVRSFVFSSSATVYGSHNTPPYHEGMPTGGCTNPYGQTKHIIELMLKDFQAASSFCGVTALRYFNPIGAHPSGKIGEAPNGIPNNLMPYITQVASGRLPQLRIFGADYNTPDGTCIRDYIHVEDLAAGHVLALNKLRTQGGFNTYNLGTGTGTSVLELVAAFEEATGRHIPYSITARRAGDIPISFAAVEAAREELGFTAEHSVRQMCEDSWRWEEKKGQRNLYMEG
ncbi:MAG: UDP-glucose 4-epimerase GalE [Defluviitaleaceae bacterium]|nr:UDP-glucose 4-epimerase GalE [Defluviitaleaceae bacterium]